MAGASFYSASDVTGIISEIAAYLTMKTDWRQVSLEVKSPGMFSLRKVDASWANTVILGALDFYGASEIQALQIVPDSAHWTVDVPDLTQPWDATTEPVWQWLAEPWPHAVSAQPVALTNLDAHGERITEAARWDEGQWELFAGAGPDVPRENIRVVPLWTLLAVDQSLNAVTRLAVGQALWRDPAELEWHSWGRTQSHLPG